MSTGTDPAEASAASAALAANKKLVTEFIRLFYNEKDLERAGALLTDDFANHHPGVGRGRDRTLATFGEVAENLPGFSLTVHRMAAEGDLVWTHSLARTGPGADGAVVVDIWRVRDGRLAEHWDVGQAVPEGMTADDMLGDAR
ncbi:nuclear transport factor 2 family protein [Nocardiopsis aegyptia]|uniref:nuclear transport factor 2 family protein n=1 Tax=Nocardiopsis aegyptia TaxID=220378 RepID=UPI00367148C8